MNKDFFYNPAGKAEPVRIEQVFAEKPAGGMIKGVTFDVLPTTAVGVNSNGNYKVIKAYRLTKAVTTEDTTIQIEKGSGVAVGDIVAYGKKGVACTAIDHSNESYDVVTVTLGIAVAKDEVLYQAAEASNDAAEPIYAPLYVTGNYIKAGNGEDAPVRLINGANLRKETACIGKDIAALMPTITLV